MKRSFILILFAIFFTFFDSSVFAYTQSDVSRSQLIFSQTVNVQDSGKSVSISKPSVSFLIIENKGVGTASINIDGGYVLVSVGTSKFYDYGDRSISSITVSGAYGNVSIYAYQYDKYPPSEVSDLSTTTISDKEIEISYKNPPESDFSKVKIFRNDVLIYQSSGSPSAQMKYKDSGLSPNQTYRYKLVTVDKLGNESYGKTTVGMTAADTVPPSNITNLTRTVYNDRISFKWTNPTDTDFVEVRIFRDGKQVAVATTPAKQLTDYDLSENTTYTYLFRSVDRNGNSSSGVSVTETTKGRPPKADGLFGVAGNKSVSLSWLKYSESVEFTNFNIYKDGVKIGTTTDSHFEIPNLKNGTDYEFYVTGENKWGESVPSDPIVAKPEMPPLPPVSNLKTIEVKPTGIKFSWSKNDFATSYLLNIRINDLEVIQKEITSTEYEVLAHKGDKVEFSVSAASEENGTWGTAKLSEVVPNVEMIGPLDPEGMPKPKDVLTSAVSLATNFWPFLLLGLACVVAPWIHFVIKRSVNDPRVNTRQAMHAGREFDRKVRMNLRKGG